MKKSGRFGMTAIGLVASLVAGEAAAQGKVTATDVVRGPTTQQLERTPLTHDDKVRKVCESILAVVKEGEPDVRDTRTYLMFETIRGAADAFCPNPSVVVTPNHVQDKPHRPSPIKAPSLQDVQNTCAILETELRMNKPEENDLHGQSTRGAIKLALAGLGCDSVLMKVLDRFEKEQGDKWERLNEKLDKEWNDLQAKFDKEWDDITAKEHEAYVGSGNWDSRSNEENEHAYFERKNAAEHSYFQNRETAIFAYFAEYEKLKRKTLSDAAIGN